MRALRRGGQLGARPSFLGLVSLALAMAGCSRAPRDASCLAVDRQAGGRYAIVDAHRRPFSEREFARLYEARTGSPELRHLDYPHRLDTAVALSVAGAFLAGSLATSVAAADACPRSGDHGCGGLAFGAVFTGIVAIALLGYGAVEAEQGSPAQHDLSRARAEELVDRYDRAPAAASASPVVTPLIGAGGLGFRY